MFASCTRLVRFSFAQRDAFRRAKKKPSLRVLTGTRSGYFRRIFSPSAFLFSNGCSSLYWNFIVPVYARGSRHDDAQSRLGLVVRTLSSLPALPDNCADSTKAAATTRRDSRGDTNSAHFCHNNSRVSPRLRYVSVLRREKIDPPHSVLTRRANISVTGWPYQSPRGLKKICRTSFEYRKKNKNIENQITANHGGRREEQLHGKVRMTMLRESIHSNMAASIISIISIVRYCDSRNKISNVTVGNASRSRSDYSVRACVVFASVMCKSDFRVRTIMRAKCVRVVTWTEHAELWIIDIITPIYVISGSTSPPAYLPGSSSHLSRRVSRPAKAHNWCTIIVWYAYFVINCIDCIFLSNMRIGRNV